MLIGVGNSRDVGCVVVDDCGVVNVGHLGHVNPRVGDVHIVDIASSGSIPGHESLARSQREPRDAGADANSETKTPSAYKCDESGRIHRAGVNRTRHPAPGSSHECPPSVMERSETPRLVFNPGPTPGINPNPMTVAIRSPSGSNRERGPHWTVVGRITPVAVLVQVRSAGHIGRNVIRRFGVIFTLV